MSVTATRELTSNVVGPNQALYVSTIETACKEIANLAMERFFSLQDPNNNDPEHIQNRVFTCSQLNLLQLLQQRSSLMTTVDDAFFSRSITKPVQDSINNLDNRIKGFFWLVVMKAYAELIENKALNPIIYSTTLAGKPNEHIKVIAEIALPIILQAVKTLDDQSPSILNEARASPNDSTPEGIHTSVHSFCANFGVFL